MTISTIGFASEKKNPIILMDRPPSPPPATTPNVEIDSNVCFECLNFFTPFFPTMYVCVMTERNNKKKGNHMALEWLTVGRYWFCRLLWWFQQNKNKTKKKFSISRSTNTNKQGGVLAWLLQSSKSDFFFASKWWWWFDWFEADGYHYFLIWFDPHDSMGVLLIQWMDVFCKKKTSGIITHTLT